LAQALDQAIDGEVQIKRGPMESFFRADHCPITALGRRCAKKSGVQAEREMNLATVAEFDDQALALEAQVFGAISGLDFASAHGARG
jgi:hypothetical protein